MFNTFSRTKGIDTTLFHTFATTIGGGFGQCRYEEEPFQSAEELAQRIPSLNRKELTLLARIGALNSVAGIVHRRDALWQVERAGK